MGELQISEHGTIRMHEGSLMDFVHYLEAHGVRCHPPGTTTLGPGHAPEIQGRLSDPADAERARALYREWVESEGRP